MTWAQEMAAAWGWWQPQCLNNTRHGSTRWDQGAWRCQACSEQRGRHARRWA
jgi:hypothetical protein